MFLWENIILIVHQSKRNLLSLLREAFVPLLSIPVFDSISQNQCFHVSSLRHVIFQHLLEVELGYAYPSS